MDCVLSGNIALRSVEKTPHVDMLLSRFDPEGSFPENSSDESVPLKRSSPATDSVLRKRLSIVKYGFAVLEK